MTDTADEIKALRALSGRRSSPAVAALAYSAANCLEIIRDCPNDPEAEQVRSILVRALAGIEKNRTGQ